MKKILLTISIIVAASYYTHGQIQYDNNNVPTSIRLINANNGPNAWYSVDLTPGGQVANGGLQIGLSGDVHKRWYLFNAYQNNGQPLEDFRISYGGNDRFTIKKEGNIGIGTNSPSGIFHAKSSTHAYSWLESVNGGAYFAASHSAGEAGGLFIVSPGSLNATITYKQGEGLRFFESGTTSMYLKGGNLGIGTASPDQKLAVNGTIRAKELICEASPWPDYVFETDYELKSLTELKNYIDLNGHLPNIPSAQEVAKNGIKIGEMNAKLLEKIEELTLYILKLEETTNVQQEHIDKLLKINNNK